MTKAFLLNTEILKDEALFSFWISRMPVSRREKLMRYRFDSDRRLSLGAGVLLYQELEKRGLSGAEITADEHGKPALPAECGLHFSLSHSGVLAVCAVSDKNVGIDVEIHRPGSEKLLRRIGTEYENERFLSFADSEKMKVFFRLWTMKEAFLKYEGVGLGLDMRHLECSFDPPYTIKKDGVLQPLCYYVTEPRAGYSLSLCSCEEPGDMDITDMTEEVDARR